MPGHDGRIERPVSTTLSGHCRNIFGLDGKALRELSGDHRLQPFIDRLPRRASEMHCGVIESIVDRIRPLRIVSIAGSTEAEGGQGGAFSLGDPTGTLALRCCRLEFSAATDDHPIVGESGLEAHQLVQDILMHGGSRAPQRIAEAAAPLRADQNACTLIDLEEVYLADIALAIAAGVKCRVAGCTG